MAPQLVLSLSVQKTTDGRSWSPFAGGSGRRLAGQLSGDILGRGCGRHGRKKFLRGYQVTDENGAVQFTTVYPGWYSGRTVHIHFRIRTFDGTQTTFEFTSQLFFEDSITDAVLSQKPDKRQGAA